jgi:hypothetical protein
MPGNAWRTRLGLTQAGAAPAPDHGKCRVETMWDRGEEEPPLTIRLAMTALE